MPATWLQLAISQQHGQYLQTNANIVALHLQRLHICSAKYVQSRREMRCKCPKPCPDQGPVRGRQSWWHLVTSCDIWCHTGQSLTMSWSCLDAALCIPLQLWRLFSSWGDSMSFLKALWLAMTSYTIYTKYMAKSEQQNEQRNVRHSTELNDFLCDKKNDSD